MVHLTYKAALAGFLETAVWYVMTLFCLTRMLVNPERGLCTWSALTKDNDSIVYLPHSPGDVISQGLTYSPSGPKQFACFFIV